MVDEYIPFEKALKDLQMSEDELKRLVSEDEIQAMREGGEIRLRRSDVDALKEKRAGDVEELVFADEEEGEDAGMVTAVLEDDSLLEDEETLDLSPEEIEVDDEPVRAGARVAPPVRSRGRAAAFRKEEKDEEATWVRALAIATTVILVYGFLVGQSIVDQQVTGVTRWLVDMFK